MKRITISKEGMDPVDILLDEKGNVESVESSDATLNSNNEEYTPEPNKTFESAPIDYSKMSAVDRVFAEMSRESVDPSRSSEAYGASIWKTRTWTKFEDMYNDKRFEKVTEKVKAWYAKNNLKPATKQDIINAVKKAEESIVNNPKFKPTNRFTWKWLKKDDVSFWVVVGGKVSFKAAFIPILNLITALISHVKHSDRDETMCYVYPLGVKENGDIVTGIAIYNAVIPSSEKYNGKNTDKD